MVIKQAIHLSTRINTNIAMHAGMSDLFRDLIAVRGIVSLTNRKLNRKIARSVAVKNYDVV